MKKNKEWLKEEMNKDMGTAKNFIPHLDVVSVDFLFKTIDQLDEPELPVIPQFVADWIINNWSINKYVTLERFMCDYNSVDLPTELYNYYDRDIENSKDKLIIAILDGYTIEKEKLYNVKLGKGYFGGFNELKVTLILNDQPGCMDDVIIYSDKKDALKIAEEIGGIVTEVVN